MTLTANQRTIAEEVAKATTSQRKKLTLYRRRDTGYSMFRARAGRYCEAFILEIVAKRKLPRDLFEFSYPYLCDMPGGVGDYFKDYEQAVIDAYREASKQC